MKEIVIPAIVSIVAIVGLVVVCCKLLDVNPSATKEVYAMVAIIGGIVGHFFSKAVRKAIHKLKVNAGGRL